MIKKLFALCLVLALVVSPVLAATSDDMRDPISWLLNLGKGGKSGQGPQGDPGPAGPQGTVLYVDCGENQCIMNQTPNMTAGPPGATGPTGPIGLTGPKGDAATIYVNNTETVLPGENAYVVNIGTENASILDFKIPRGYNGTAGPPGAKGDQGPQGDPGPTGPANMTAGPPGSPGAPGANGTAATINVNYTFTGAVGTSALVTNVGTTSAALLDFTIPTGTTDSLTFPCKACSAGTIYKGQAVYISGAAGNNPIVCQADNTDTTKSRVVGLMIADTAANGQGGVRRAGELEPVDTRTTNTVINPNSETWNAGDLLFATTGGGLTKVRPTSGRSVKVAYVTEAAGVNAGLLAYPMENPVWVTAASNEDIVLRAGDSAGAKKISFRNYLNTEMAYINSQGYASLNGTDLQSKKITSVADPTNNQDAATKNYVDTRGFITSTYNATYDAKNNYNASYITSTFNSTYDAKPDSTYNATYDAKTNYNSSYWTGTNYNATYDGQSNYNASYLTSTFNATYDSKPSSTYNATYDAKTNYNASYWTGSNYNSSYLTSSYNATYDAKTNYNSSYVELSNSSYFLTDGSRSMLGNISFIGQFYINGLTDPSQAQDAATKNYVDTRPANNYNASYLTSTYNATYDAKTNYNASYITSTYNATYDAKNNYNASYWTGTNYNASYWTGTNYNSSYLTSTYNTTYDAKTNYNASYVTLTNGSYILGTNLSYYLVDGTRAMTGNLSMGSKYINNLISGGLGSDAVNKSYVDSIAGNYNATYDAKPSIATIYPVGSIYISTVSTNPNTLFGVGTWAAFGTGRVLVGINASDTNFDVVEEVGGTKTVASAGTVASIAASGDNAVKAGTSASTAAPISHTHAAPAYTGMATSIVQPYIVVYMWERTP